MMEGNVWQIVALSLRVAGIAIVVALPIAFLVAWILPGLIFRASLWYRLLSPCRWFCRRW